MLASKLLDGMRHRNGHAAEQAAVVAFGRFALESRDIDATIERCVDLVTALLGARVGVVLRFAAPDRLEVVQVRGTSTMAPGQQFPVPPEVLAAIGKAQNPIRIVDSLAEGGLPALGPAEVSGSRSVLSVGVFTGRGAWGRLAVMDPRPIDFTDADVDLLKSVAHLLAAAVERDRSERAQAELAAFGRFALESRDLAATLERAVDAATRAVGVPMGGVTRLLDTPGRGVLECGCGPGAFRVGEEFDVPRWWVDDEHGGSEPLAVPDWEADTTLGPTPLVTGSGARSTLAVTLMVGGRPWGRMGLADLCPRWFSQADVDLLSALAHMLAAAIERDRFEARWRERAHDLQRALLPAALPTVPGIEVAARYVPAGGGEVGGDWYDLLPLPQGGVGLVIGDVEGHDSAAAAVMGQVRNALRAYAAEGYTPAEVMTRVNRFVSAQTDRLVTCCYAELRPDMRSLTCVTAGHPPPLILAPGGTMRPVRHRFGLLLGCESGRHYEERTTLLPPGASLLLFTDGLLDDAPAAIYNGLPALSAAVRRRPVESVEALAEHLITVPPGAPTPRDDAALLVVRLLAGDRSVDEGSPVAQASRVFAASGDSAGAARRFVRDVLVSWDLAAIEDRAALGVSELVTNALLHTTSPIQLDVRRRASDRVWVGVQDESDRQPQLRSLTCDEISGRGLAIVAALADLWGVDDDPRRGGKIVWMEFLASG